MKVAIIATGRMARGFATVLVPKQEQAVFAWLRTWGFTLSTSGA